MRKILPRKSFVLADDFCASNGDLPSRSSEGLNPSDSKGLELSLVDKYKLLPGPKAIDPPVWQQVSRCVSTSSIFFSDAMSILLPSKVKRDRTLAAFAGVE